MLHCLFPVAGNYGLSFVEINVLLAVELSDFCSVLLAF